MAEGKALLVIDMQKGSFTPETPRFDTDVVVDKINMLASAFRKEGSPVVFIQHDGTGSGSFEKYAPDWALLDELEVVEGDVLIDKYVNDVFYQSKMQSTLEKLNIKQLYITGCATDFCVESTIQSALVKDYELIVISDAHTTGDRPHLPAQKIIEHYNWVWQNMIPTKGKVEVVSAESVLEH